MIFLCSSVKVIDNLDMVHDIRFHYCVITSLSHSDCMNIILLLIVFMIEISENVIECKYVISIS